MSVFSGFLVENVAVVVAAAVVVVAVVDVVVAVGLLVAVMLQFRLMRNKISEKENVLLSGQ